MRMSPSQLRETFKIALQDRAPKAAKEMQRDGTLEAFLGRMTQMVSEQVDMAADRANLKHSSDPVEAVQEANYAVNVAQEVALAQVIEEIDALNL